MRSGGPIGESGHPRGHAGESGLRSGPSASGEQEGQRTEWPSLSLFLALSLSLPLSSPSAFFLTPLHVYFGDENHNRR